MTNKNDVTGDSQNIPWPRDDFGFISPLRAAIRDAVQKTRGHPEKVALVVSTMKIGFLYAKARGDLLHEKLYAAGLAVAEAEAEVATEAAPEDEPKAVVPADVTADVAVVTAEPETSDAG